MRWILFVPIVVALGVIMVPGLYYTGYIPVTVNSSLLSPIYDEGQLHSKSILDVEGTLIDKQTELTFVKNGNVDAPYVYTTWTLQITDTLKSSLDSEKIQFKTSGGTYQNIEHNVLEKIHMNIGDKILVFLTKDLDSQWGDSYYVTGVQSGVYMIDEMRAYNDLKKVDIALDELKTSLRSMN